MTPATYESPFRWTIHRNRGGHPRWWQRAYEAWLVLSGRYTLWHAWHDGKHEGSTHEYHRIVENGGDLTPLLNAAIAELLGDMNEQTRGIFRRDIWARYKAARAPFPSKDDRRA